MMTTEYETKVMRGGPQNRRIKKLLKEGWEIVSVSGGELLTAQTTVLRRPKSEETPTWRKAIRDLMVKNTEKEQ